MRSGGHLLLLLSAFIAVVSTTELKEIFTWKTLNYELNKAEQIQSKNSYVATNNIPTAFAVAGNRMFIAVPRMAANGIVSTLNYVRFPGSIDMLQKPISPCLVPYPDLPSNTKHYGQNKFKPLTSVYTLRVDQKCNNLWVVDNLKNGGGRLVLFDLKTDTWKNDHFFSDNGSGLESVDNRKMPIYASMTIETVGEFCTEAFVYIADMSNNNLFLYHLNHKETTKRMIKSIKFDPISSQINHKFGNQDYELDFGLFGMAVDGNNFFFSPMSSSLQYRIPKDRIHEAVTEDDIFEVGHKGSKSQTTTTVIQDGIMYFTQISKSAVRCWDMAKTFKPNHLETVASDKEKMVYPTDIIVYQGKLWVLSSQVPVYSKGVVIHPNVVNFRVLVSEIGGVRCAASRFQSIFLTFVSLLVILVLEQRV